MSEFPQEFVIHNQAELEDLAWEIEASAGQFSLLLARCNYMNLRSQLVELLRQLCPLDIRVLILQPSETALYTCIQAELNGEYPDALMVLGLETAEHLEQLLSTANQVREEFRKNCPFPVILWVTDDVQRFLIQTAPDLESWATKTYFTLSPEALYGGLQQASDRLFSAFLHSSQLQDQSPSPLSINLGYFSFSEVSLALEDLRNQNQELTPYLKASLDFAQGIQTDDPVRALAFFERSYQFWRQGYQELDGGMNAENFVLRKGLLLLHKGQAQYAIGESNVQNPKWDEVRQSLQEAMNTFEQAHRHDLATLCIPPLETLLQKVQDWDALEATARLGLDLHRNYSNQLRLSQDYGFLAQSALAKKQWSKAKQFAQQALTELAKELEERVWLQGLYLLFLAQAEKQLGAPKEAITHLIEADAQAVSDCGYPKIAIHILNELRNLYFDQQQYLEAFQAKQRRLSIEQQYGFRAFIGAGRLQPRRQEATAKFHEPVEGAVATEITVTARQYDLARLIERIGRRDYRLIVLHGSSGVGKSSLIYAGLVPSLRQKIIDARSNIPIVQSVYIQWENELNRLLDRVLREMNNEQHSYQFDVTKPILDSLLEKISRLTQQNFRTVIIFDQFEEFFFVYRFPESRKSFFEFLTKCSQFLPLKIIISLREDYLHFLLEFNRLPAAVQAGIDVLSRHILYNLGNLSSDDAQTIIQESARRAHFYLEPSLIKQLAEDLSRETGTVRPIELQIIGSQLQEDGITTLAEYQKSQGDSKQYLVGRYLNQIIVDCGASNQKIAELVLFLLTDEKGIRPLKTREELGKEISVLVDNLVVEDDSLDVVLKILVGSGLVVLSPGNPTNQYQLVHDYIASFIRLYREPQLAVLAAELEAEKGQRKQAEALRMRVEQQLSQVLRRRLKEAYLVGSAFALISIFTLGLWLNAEQKRKQIEIAEIEALNSLSEARLLSNDKLEALVASMQAGQRAQHINAPNDLQEDVINQLRKIFISGIQEENRLEGHKDFVLCVVYSPDGETIVSADASGEIRIWDRDGVLLRTIKAHKGNIWMVSFNPKGGSFVSVGEDGQIKLWNFEGELLRSFEPLTGEVMSVAVSPNGHNFATAGDDGKIRIWEYDGTLLKTFVAHNSYISDLSFSPDGQLLASASGDKTVKLWKTSGTLIKTFSGHTDVVWSVAFSPEGKALASASFDKTVKLWDLDGTLVQTLKSHSDRVNDVSFSPDGRFIASSSIDKTIIVSQRNGHVLTSLRGHQVGVRGVSFSPVGTNLASAGLDKTVRIWQYNEPPLNLIGHTGNLRSISFSGDGETIATSSTDRTIRIWHRSGTISKTSNILTERITDLSFSPNGKMIAGGGGDGSVKLWNLGSDVMSLQGHTKTVWNVKFSPDGEILASTSADHTIRLWTSKGALIKILKGHQDTVTSVSFSPDSQIFVSGSFDGNIRIWSRDASLLKTISTDQGPVNFVSFSPNGEIIVSAGDDGTIKLWKPDGTLIKVLSGHQNPVISLALSSDNKLLASGDASGIVILWSMEGIQLQSLQNPGLIWDLSFSPDSRMLAVASDDKVARVWSLNRSRLDSLASDDLEVLLTQGCNWLESYLNTNTRAVIDINQFCNNPNRS